MKNGFLMLLVFTMFKMLPSQAQIVTPQPSPLGKLEQRVGLTDVSIVYSRPSSKGRVVFGDLVPFDKLWRTGANASTKITFSDPVSIDGKSVPAGEYALFSIPGQREWTLILHNDLKTGVQDYKEANDLIRFKAVPEKIQDRIETFTIQMANVDTKQADVELLWEQTRVKFTISVEFDEKVRQQIQKVMEGPSANDYFAAARYYFDNNIDMNRALEWVNLSLQKSERFWVLRTKAQILAALKNYKEAIVVAQRSSELAKAAGNEEYVKMNDLSIAEWRRMR